MAVQHVVEGPEGGRWLVEAAPIDLTDDEPWEVRVEGPDGSHVFVAGTEEVAERLVLILGEELELGIPPKPTPASSP